MDRDFIRTLRAVFAAFAGAVVIYALLVIGLIVPRMLLSKGKLSLFAVMLFLGVLFPLIAVAFAGAVGAHAYAARSTRFAALVGLLFGLAYLGFCLRAGSLTYRTSAFGVTLAGVSFMTGILTQRIERQSRLGPHGGTRGQTGRSP